MEKGRKSYIVFYPVAGAPYGPGTLAAQKHQVNRSSITKSEKKYGHLRVNVDIFVKKDGKFVKIGNADLFDLHKEVV